MFIELIDGYAQLAILAVFRFELSFSHVLGKLLSDEFLPAVLARLQCMEVLLVILPEVNVDHHRTLIALLNVPAAIREVTVDLTLGKELRAVVAALHHRGLHGNDNKGTESKIRLLEY